jgi:hypothetical protein
MTMATRPVMSASRYDNTAAANAGTVINLILLLAAGAFGCWLVGTRGLDIGTDTSTYAMFFHYLGGGAFQTRLEPGFVLVSYLLKRAGFDVIGYQIALFLLLLVIIAVTSRRYFDYLGATRGYLIFLCASLMLLYLSPMFVNGSINAVRQGLAALLVFAALLSFQQRKWWLFALYGAVASSLHLSSLLYLAFAPALFLSARTLRYVDAMAFVVYCTGLSLILVRAAIPALYQFVMTYAFDPEYRAGVRIDFAVFSIFWYALPLLLAPLVRSPYRERIKESTATYLVMLLPFFTIGWGSYSNRFLLPAWLATSLVLAAILCHSRIAPLRNPLLIWVGLIVACPVFYYYVTNVIVI